MAALFPCQALRQLMLRQVAARDSAGWGRGPRDATTRKSGRTRRWFHEPKLVPAGVDPCKRAERRFILARLDAATRPRPARMARRSRRCRPAGCATGSQGCALRDCRTAVESRTPHPRDHLDITGSIGGWPAGALRPSGGSGCGPATDLGRRDTVPVDNPGLRRRDWRPSGPTALSQQAGQCPA